MTKSSEFRPRSGVKATTYNTFYATTRRSEGCWQWLDRTQTRKGFLRTKFRVTEQYRSPQWVSWYIHCGKPPAGMEVVPVCGNEFCVRPDHLKLVLCKKVQIDQIRGDLFLGKPIPQIARDLGLSVPTIYRKVKKFNLREL